MVTHHPDTQLLNEFSSGALPLAQSICISLHLKYCGQCRRNHQQLQQLASAMFEHLSPAAVDNGLLQGVLSRLDEAPPLRYPTSGDREEGWPALVQRMMAGDYADLDWRRMGPSLRISHLRTGDPDHEFALYHIRAGGSVPRHTHRGTELTLVLEGSFSDESGVYQQGDFLVRDDHDVHTPTAAQDADCVCVGVLDAPIRFTRWNYRLLNPFLRLQAQ